MWIQTCLLPQCSLAGAALSGGAAVAHLTQRRHSTSIVSRNTLQAGVSNSPFRERIGSTRLPDRPRLRFDAVPGKSLLERGQSQVEEVHDEIYDEGPMEPRIKSNASLAEILESMRHQVTGVGFLAQTVSLPSNAFVSIYAIQWLLNHIEGITPERAKNIMEGFLREKMICHASGAFSKCFIVGYYMYYISQQKKDPKDGAEYIPPLGDLQSFENEWMEVEVLGPRSPLLPKESPHGAINISNSSTSPQTDETGVPAFLCDDIDPNYMHLDSDSEMPLYKNTHLDIDVNSKSDRIEWGHARYQATFRPDQAYEMCIQWAVASGNIVADLIIGWARKAQSCKLQMVPIPADPLALPFTSKSDPLRGPIYVPLNEEPLMRHKTALFNGFPEETWAQRLFLFQEAIVGKFGFIKCTVESTSHSSGGGGSTGSASVGDHLYVHVTGNMFILIPTTLKPSEHRVLRHRPANKPLNASRYPVHSDVAPSPHEAYITRHVSGKNKDDYDNSRRMGFLWSWNHMVSKKWKYSQTPATGDEKFQIKFLKDFKHFCANQEQRLSQFWEQCWELKDAVLPT